MAVMSNIHVVVVGAGYAGVAAALRLAWRTRGRVCITLVNPTELFVERIRLHQALAGPRPPARSLSRLLRGTGIMLVIGHATGVDLMARTVTVAGEHLSWNRLVLALGSVPDLSAPWAVGMAGGPDLAALSARLPDLAQRRARVAVVGGGLTGIETAAELAERWPGLEVALLTDRPLLAGWSAAGQAHVRDALDRLGVRVEEGRRVAAARPGILSVGNEERAVDACLWVGGFAFPDLARRAGLSVNAAG